jgi:hypothetical protein
VLEQANEAQVQGMNVLVRICALKEKRAQKLLLNRKSPLAIVLGGSARDGIGG